MLSLLPHSDAWNTNCAYIRLSELKQAREAARLVDIPLDASSDNEALTLASHMVQQALKHQQDVGMQVLMLADALSQESAARNLVPCTVYHVP